MIAPWDMEAWRASLQISRYRSALNPQEGLHPSALLLSESMLAYVHALLLVKTLIFIYDTLHFTFCQ